jgi:hypothetical protein
VGNAFGWLISNLESYWLDRPDALFRPGVGKSKPTSGPTGFSHLEIGELGWARNVDSPLRP